MIDLDNLKEIKTLDKQDVLGSIEQLGLQCEQAWEEVGKIKFPPQYKHAHNIVFSGMGGSALGAYVVKSLFFDNLSLPFEIVNDYHLPSYAHEKTLVILSSYSGTTEETLSTAHEALERKALVTGLTSGGKLGNIFKQEKLPAYIYTPKYNPSNQPRMGLGYPLLGLIGILNHLGFLKSLDEDVVTIKDILNQGNLLYGVKAKKSRNAAKQLAEDLINKIPVIVSAGHLTQVGRVFRNQLHECAKTFAAYHDIPELNHHLMEGLVNPGTNSRTLHFIFLNSLLFSSRIAKRIGITKEVIRKNGIKADEFMPGSKNKLVQAVECIQFASYVNYYLALLNRIDPSKIPWVDYFKARLAKM